MADIDQCSGPLERATRLLLALACEGESRPLAAHASSLGIPLSTAYRIAAQLSKHGLLAPGKRGHFGPGLTLTELAARADPRTILAGAARPLLRKLARSTRATAHLGVLEGDMVTYLVKEQGGGALFTREGGQLEAYCSAIGKILLAASDRWSLDAYLGSGPFVALTGRTITDPHLIRDGIAAVARQDYAIDDREVADDLVCVAVPIRDRNGKVVAAISLSMQTITIPIEESRARLRACASAIEKRLGRSPRQAQVRFDDGVGVAADCGF
jgi:DNA-binding IclR family transcriptional regulator